MKSDGSSGRFAPARWKTMSLVPSARRASSAGVSREIMCGARPSSRRRTVRLLPIKPFAPVTATIGLAVGIGRLASEHRAHVRKLAQYVRSFIYPELPGVIRAEILDPGHKLLTFA